MTNLVILGKESPGLDELQAELIRNGYSCSFTPYDEDAAGEVSGQSPDLVIAEVDGYQSAEKTKEYIREIKLRKLLPVIALVSEDMMDDIDIDLNLDDFISSPANTRELTLRIKRLLNRDKVGDSGETIRCEGLIIDLARCEVSVDGKKIGLTFKEYELLKFLAANSGRVYTREVLLDKIWGIDYYGGDRTVDVHVRRLRSKIEKPGQVFIETVRNIGYKFREDTDAQSPG